MKLKTFFILTALLLAPLAVAHASDAAKPAKPNILFLFADDWAWPHASCLGTPGIQTPTFDRLVREGALFRNAHVVAPSCSPSRAAILTTNQQSKIDNAFVRRFRCVVEFSVKQPGGTLTVH